MEKFSSNDRRKPAANKKFAIAALSTKTQKIYTQINTPATNLGALRKIAKEIQKDHPSPMKQLPHQYSAIITNSYPSDIRIFISRILPILLEYYYLPFNFDKSLELNRFDWGNRYNRSEEFTLGEEAYPRISLIRNVLGEVEFTDEWESSTLELLDFCPPQMDDTLRLKIECSESFLLTDKGTHQCSIDFETDNSAIYGMIMDAVQEILAQFKNACVQAN